MSTSTRSDHCHRMTPIDLSQKQGAKLPPTPENTHFSERAVEIDAVMIYWCQDSLRIEWPKLRSVLSELIVWERPYQNWMHDDTNIYTFVRPESYGLQVLHGLAGTAFCRAMDQRFRPEQMTWAPFPPSYHLVGAILAQWRLAPVDDARPLSSVSAARVQTPSNSTRPSPVHWSSLVD